MIVPHIFLWGSYFFCLASVARLPSVARLHSIWWAPPSPERASGFFARAVSSASAVSSGPCHPRRSAPRPSGSSRLTHASPSPTGSFRLSRASYFLRLRSGILVASWQGLHVLPAAAISR